MAAKTKQVQQAGSIDKPSKEILRYNLISGSILMVRDLLPMLVRWGVFVYAIYTVGDIAKSLSGKTSFAYYDIAVSFVTDLNMSEWFAYAFGLLFGGGGTIFGYKERKLRKRKTEYLADRNAKLEKIIDPNRSSSNLQTTGDTREGD
jgi:hypothetical protein